MLMTNMFKVKPEKVNIVCAIKNTRKFAGRMPIITRSAQQHNNTFIYTLIGVSLSQSCSIVISASVMEGAVLFIRPL